MGLGSLGCLPLITITSFQQIFCTGVRGFPLESGEILSAGVGVAYAGKRCSTFSLLATVCDTPCKGYHHSSCVAHTTTTAKPQEWWDFPIGCIAFKIKAAVFIIGSGGQKWQPLLLQSIKVGVKSDRHFTDCQETRRRYPRLRQRRLRL